MERMPMVMALAISRVLPTPARSHARRPVRFDSRSRNAVDSALWDLESKRTGRRATDGKNIQQLGASNARFDLAASGFQLRQHGVRRLAVIIDPRRFAATHM